MAFTPRLAPHFTRLLIVAVIGVTGGVMAVTGPAHAQDYGQSDQQGADQQGAEQQGGDQYRCDDSRTRCAYYRCDPSGRSCERSSDWQMRDYNRGVDGDAPREDDQADADRNDNDAQRYGAEGSGSDQGGDYARNEQDQGGPPPPTTARRGDGAEYRCTDDGQRCAYYRCDTDGENCHRISGWSSRADSNRRPDYNGW